MKSVSVIIPTFNAMDWLRDSLPLFLNQKYSGNWDIMIIDSGSTDGTLSFLASHDRIRIHTIPNTTFGHGKTRNLATSLASSELLLFTVQDACPSSPQWISGMVNDMLAYNLDAVCGGQAVPHDADKNPVQWYRPLTETNHVEIVRGEEFRVWSPERQVSACRWDNVNALYKREILLKRQFKDVRFGEDMAWAKSLLNTGGTIGYAAAHKVWHYHHQHQGYTRKRVLNQLYWRQKIFGTMPASSNPPSLTSLFRTMKSIVWHAGIWHPRRVIHWLAYNRRIRKESYEAAQEFTKASSKGSIELDNLYESLGTTSPMATKLKNP